MLTWEVHPSLPTGLSIDSSTGEISGTPTIVSQTTYTVYANNTEVVEQQLLILPSLILSHLYHTPGPYIETIDLSMTTGTQLLRWNSPYMEIHPALPTGLSIDSSTGEISGANCIVSRHLTQFTLTTLVAAEQQHRYNNQ